MKNRKMIVSTNAVEFNQELERLQSDGWDVVPESLNVDVKTKPSHDPRLSDIFMYTYAVFVEKERS